MYTVGLFHFDNNYDNTGSGDISFTGGTFPATFKFGTHSVYTNATSNASADLAFGLDDFTIDFWAQYGSTTSETYFARYDSDYIHLHKPASSNTVYFKVNNATIGTYTSGFGVWNHIAIVKYNGVIKCYRNGSSIGSVANSKDFSGTRSIITSSNYGYVDELRISKGIARWTTNFTPPTEPYTDISYLISGSSSEDARIYVLDETNNTLDATSAITAGNYNISVSNNNAKSVLARSLIDNKTVSYGTVIPIIGGID